jgi:hypothetical protein
MVATAIVVFAFKVNLAVSLTLMLVVLPVRLLNVAVELHEGAFVFNGFLLPSFHLFLADLLFSLGLTLLFYRAAFRAAN